MPNIQLMVFALPVVTHACIDDICKYTSKLFRRAHTFISLWIRTQTTIERARASNENNVQLKPQQSLDVQIIIGRVVVLVVFFVCMIVC